MCLCRDRVHSEATQHQSLINVQLLSNENLNFDVSIVTVPFYTICKGDHLVFATVRSGNIKDSYESVKVVGFRNKTCNSLPF